MKILVTGAKGFIGKNLVYELKNKGFSTIYEYDIETSEEKLKEYTRDCDFVFHLAGINRPKSMDEFMEGNFGFTNILLNALINNRNTCPVLVSSSVQAELDNHYGKSKKASEELLLNYKNKTGASVYIYRLPNVFGKWCKPNYNSVVATFCHNIAKGLDIKVNDPNTVLKLVYIDDVVKEMIFALKGQTAGKVEPVYEITLGKLSELLYSFKKTRKNLSLPNLEDGLEKVLFSTFLSYLPKNEFSYSLKMNTDSRGAFTEILRTTNIGQFSVNITKPNITKGNHWHNTKCEKFTVVGGNGLIKFRKIGTDEIIEYYVSGEKIETVDIPVGYTHSISNIGETDLITLMWANEAFCPEEPDTYIEEVQQ